MSDPPTSPTRAMFDPAAIVEQAPRPILLLDSQGVVRWANRAAGDLAGLPSTALTGRNVLEFIVDDDAALVLESMEYLLDRPGRFRPMEFRYRRPDGSTGVVEAVSANHLHDPAVNGIVVQAHDITERRIIDQILASIASGATFSVTLRLVARLVEEQLDRTRVIIGVDPVDGRFRSAISVFDLVDELAGSEALSEPIDGHQPDEPGSRESPWSRAIRTRTPVIASSLDEIPPGLREEARQQGFSACWVTPVVSPVSGQVEGALIIWRADPGPPSPGARAVNERAARLVALALERRRSHDLLSHAARHDTLTHLPNRAQFFQRLSRELRRSGRLVAVLYLDLDGFKSVNDRYGHRAGDEVLISVARRIEATLRPDDLTARLGGDEFGVICCHLHAPEEAITIAERLIESLALPIPLPPDAIRSPEMAELAGAPVVELDADSLIEVSIGVTIGIAFGAEVGTDHELLVELADAAMYQGKSAGRGVWRLSGDLEQR